MTDCSSLIWCFSQCFTSIPRPRNCLQNARSEKTHSDDLGQREALPSATDTSGSERQQNFKERGRGRDSLKTRCSTDDKTRELIWCVSQEWIFTIQTLYILNSIKHVKMCAYTDPFLLLSCRAINCSVPFVNPWNTTWWEMVSVFSGTLWLWGKLVCKQRCASKRNLAIPSLRNGCFSFHGILVKKCCQLQYKRIQFKSSAT